MGKMDVCESFLSKLTTNKTTAEGKVALRAVTMATKSRKMKTLQDLQKRRYGTAPTIIGQHSERLGIDILELPTRFLHDNDFVDEDDEDDEDDEENLDGLDTSVKMRVILLTLNIYSRKKISQFLEEQMDCHSVYQRRVFINKPTFRTDVVTEASFHK